MVTWRPGWWITLRRMPRGERGGRAVGALAERAVHRHVAGPGRRPRQGSGEGAEVPSACLAEPCQRRSHARGAGPLDLAQGDLQGRRGVGVPLDDLRLRLEQREPVEQSHRRVLEQRLTDADRRGGRVEAEQVGSHKRRRDADDGAALVGSGCGGAAIGVAAKAGTIEGCCQPEGQHPHQQGGAAGRGQLAHVVDIQPATRRDRLRHGKHVVPGTGVLVRMGGDRAPQRGGDAAGGVAQLGHPATLAGGAWPPRGGAILCDMASSTPAVLRVAAPLARAAAGATRGSSLLSAASAALRRLESTAPETGQQRHPLAPAALRVERGKSHGNGTRADQTAITVWFGQGPALPGPGGGDALRSAVRIGGSVLGAAALAAMTVIAARREEQRKVIDAPTPAVPQP